MVMRVSSLLRQVTAVVLALCAGHCFAETGLVAHYTFAESRGDTAVDSSGNGNDGTIVDASRVSTANGYALKFGGADSRVILGSDPRIGTAGDSAFMAWIRLDAPIADATTNWTIFSNEVLGQSGRMLRVDGATSKLCFRNNSTSNGTEPVISDRPLAKHTFYHVAVVRKGDTATLFVDGLADVSGPCKGQAPATEPFTLSCSGQPIDGLIGTTRIYDRALSAGEVMAEYRKDAGVMGKDTSSFGRIRVTPFLYLDEGEVIAALDLTGILPVAHGEEVSITLSEAQRGVIEAREISPIPDSGEQDCIFSTQELLPGDYKVQAVVREAAGKEKASSEFSFTYPRGLPAVPPPASVTVPALPPPPPPVEYQLDLGKGGGLLLTVRGERYPIETYCSYPNGGYNRLTVSDAPADAEAGWQVSTQRLDAITYEVKAAGQFYSIDRLVKLYPDRVSVEDTVVNTTPEALGMFLGSTLDASGKGFERAFLAGNEATETRSPVKLGANSTVFLGKPNLGIGMIALDDVFIAQSRGTFAQGQASLLSDSFAMDVGASYTLEWAIYPQSTGDYYDFINAVRTVENRNGTIDGGLGINHYVRDGADPSKEYIESRGLKYLVIGGLTHPADDNQVSLEGVEFLSYPKERQRLTERIAAVQKLYPDLKMGFHIAHSLYATDRPRETMPDSLVTNPDGSLPLYSEGEWYFSDERLSQGWRWRTYYATPNNRLGQALMKSVDVMVDEMGCKLAFMDGFGACYGADFTYDTWDGHTAELDPETKTIGQKKASVALLQQEAMVAFARRMHSKGATVIANGTSPTRTVMRETYIIHDSEIVAGPWMHLTPTPAALANPDAVMDKGDQGALCLYRDLQDKLRFGNLFFHYGDLGVHLPRKQISAYMYPLTFEELHAGYVKGRQRLVTLNPGVYGWRGDRSLHQAYLSDARGVIVPSSFMTTVDAEGARTRLDLGENETAVLRRIPVTLTAEQPVNVVTVQYDESAIVLVMNGTGASTLTVSDGDFRVRPNTEYAVNGKRIESGPEGVLQLSLDLDGETVVEVGNGMGVG